MANTTFSGTVRSESGVKVVSKNSTTGAYTDKMTFDSSGRMITTTGSHLKYTAATGYAGEAGRTPPSDGGRDQWPAEQGRAGNPGFRGAERVGGTNPEYPAQPRIQAGRGLKAFQLHQMQDHLLPFPGRLPAMR